MFPPVRACEHGCYAPDRLTPEQAAEEKLRYDKSRFTPDELRRRWGALLKGESVPDPDSECQELPTERIRCRAGSSTFWVTWDRQLRPCGMMTEPGVPLALGGFGVSWREIRRLREEIMVPAKCSACAMSHACDQCAAVCYAESGSFTAAPAYMCEQTSCFLSKIRKDPIWKMPENGGKN